MSEKLVYIEAVSTGGHMIDITFEKEAYEDVMLIHGPSGQATLTSDGAIHPNSGINWSNIVYWRVKNKAEVDGWYTSGQERG